MKLYPDLYFVIQEYGRYLRHTHNLEKSKEMLEKAVQLNDTTFSRHHLALTLKKMVGKDTPVFGKHFQYSYPKDERDQSNNAYCGCDELSRSKEFGSFSVDAEQKVDSSIQYKTVEYNQTFTTTLFERCKSANSVLHHEESFTKCDALAFEIEFLVPKTVKVSKSPSIVYNYTK